MVQSVNLYGVIPSLSQHTQKFQRQRLVLFRPARRFQLMERKKIIRKYFKLSNSTYIIKRFGEKVAKQCRILFCQIKLRLLDKSDRRRKKTLMCFIKQIERKDALILYRVLTVSLIYRENLHILCLSYTSVSADVVPTLLCCRRLFYSLQQLPYEFNQTIILTVCWQQLYKHGNPLTSSLLDPISPQQFTNRTVGNVKFRIY